MSYLAPVKDMFFVLKHIAAYDAVTQLPCFDGMDFDTAQAVVEECAKFCEAVVAPLNAVGDRTPASWKDGVVTTAPGFKEGVVSPNPIFFR